MKRHILILSFIFFYLISSAQTVTLSILQDYAVSEIPIITQIGDMLKSSSPIGNQWFKDGVEMAGESNQTLVISHSGNYRVSVTLGSGCSSESSIYSAIKTDIPIIQTSDFKCKVFPNPNNGTFIIELESDHSQVFVLELFTPKGESIVKQTVNHLPGTQQILFGKTSLVIGVYYLQIKYGSKFVSRQIIVN